MWPLLLIPIAAAIFGNDSKDGVLSPPTKPDPNLPPGPNWDPGPGGAGVSCDWIYQRAEGADDAGLVAAYAGLRSNPFAGPGDWYAFADIAESFGAHDVADCARNVAQNMQLIEGGG